MKYKSQHQHYLIRQRMREIGNFIYEFRKLHGDKNLTDILSPQYYDDIVTVINKIAGLNNTNGKYKAPSTAYNLGLHIKGIANILEAECIKSKDNQKRMDVKDLICLMNEGFTTDINKTVSKNQTEQKRHKKIMLPTREDIKTLQTFLRTGIEQAIKGLERNFSVRCWKDLAGYLLILLQLFNRRRAGELERIEIVDYNK